MSRVLLLVALFAIAVVAPLGTLAQDATPGASPAGMSLPLTPDPALCTIEPLTPEEILAQVPADGPLPTAEPNTFPDPFLLTGEPADPATTAAVTAAITQLLACFNAGDLFRIFALTSERGLIDPEVFGPPPGTTFAEAEAMLAQLAAEGVSPLPQEAWITLLDVITVRLLTDGRVGALHVDVSPGDDEVPGPRLVFTLWAFENGIWKFDGSLDDPYGMVAGPS